MINNISISELNNNENIIDIRSNEKYQNGHINNAINIPSDVLMSNPQKYLNINTKYYICCPRGILSVKVCTFLSRMGYDVVNINGGYDAWLKCNKNK